MKIILETYKEEKTLYPNISSQEQDNFAMPMPGATCSLAGATCTCTSCCF